MTSERKTSGTAPSRAARLGMRVAVASMPTPQAAEITPMVNLSTPCRSSASGTSGKATPACRPMAAQAARMGSNDRHIDGAAMLFDGCTQMAFGAERRRFVDLARGFGGVFLLAAPHIGIEAVARQKLAVPAAFGDTAAVEDDDLVGIDDGRQAMGDHYRGAAAAHLFERALDFLLGAGVERAGRLVEQQDLRVLEDGTGDRHPLLRAAGQLQAALADGGLVARRQPLDKIVDAGEARG